MDETFLGEIRLFAGNYAPPGWELCNGQLLLIEDHQGLYSLIGNIYGGDGKTTFALPDCRGRLPVSFNPKLGYALGSLGGLEQVSINLNQLPSHTHDLQAANTLATQREPRENWLASPEKAQTYCSILNAPDQGLHSETIDYSAGGDFPHNNLQPALCVSFIIAIIGTYPH